MRFAITNPLILEKQKQFTPGDFCLSEGPQRALETRFEDGLESIEENQSAKVFGTVLWSWKSKYHGPMGTLQYQSD